MSPVVNETRNGVLNETTNTVHKHETGTAEYETRCGLTHHVARDYLERMPIERAVARNDTSKCGRCFPEAGGY